MGLLDEKEPLIQEPGLFAVVHHTGHKGARLEGRDDPDAGRDHTRTRRCFVFG